MNLHKFGSTSIAMILIVSLLTLAYIAAWRVAAQDPVAQGTNIPVIINIYNDGGTADQAKEAVAEASGILQQAGYKLTVVKVNTGVTAGDAGSDGVLSPANNYKEFRDVVKAGKDELDKTPNKKGIKIDFVKTPWDGSTTPGWAYHDEPVAVVKNRGTAGATGQTIAHEIGHILTLVGRYKIDDTTTADDAGHAPHGAGGSHDGNIMAPSSYRTGTHLTPNQINEVLKKKYVRGKCSTQWEEAYPATKDKQQYGTNTGHQVTGPPYLGIFSTTLWSIDGTSDIEGQLSLDDLFSGTVDATYALVFDSDNNAGTGYSYGGFSGMDFALELNVTGSGGVYSINGEVRDLSTNSTRSLPEDPVIASAELVADLDGVGATPILDHLYFTLPKQYVGIDTTLTSMSVTEIPVGVLAQESSIIYDNSSFILCLNQWQRDPTLGTLTGVPTPGVSYSFSVSGLKPNSAFDLFVDDRLVLSDMLDASGDFIGNFVFPSDLQNTEMHFLTAQDSTGEFAYSITCPEALTQVGGIVIPVDKFGLLAPYIGLAAAVSLATVATAVYVKRGKHKEKKP